MPYHIALGYNGEVVGCPVDSDWYIRKTAPSEQERRIMEANSHNKPRRFNLGQYIFCYVKGEWVQGCVIGVNVGDRRRFPYRLELDDSTEILVPVDGPSHVRLDKPAKVAVEADTANIIGRGGGALALQQGFAEHEIVDMSSDKRNTR